MPSCPPLQPVTKVTRQVRKRAHILDAHVEKMIGVVGRIGETAAAAAVPVDHDDLERPDGLPGQMNG